MTFAEYKEALNNYCSDIRLANDYKSIIKQAINYIANDCVPLSLVSNDVVAHKPLRFLDKETVTFIREPELPQGEEDLLDIDRDLEMAVVYYSAYLLAPSSSKMPYKMEYLRVVENHNFTHYKLKGGNA